MATNKLLPFANGVGANVTDYDTWSALATLLSQGFTTGVARSDYANRVFAQGALASYILGQFVVDQTAHDADLNESVFYTNFKNALVAYIKQNAVSLDTVQTIGGVKTFTSSPIVPTPASGDNSQKVASTAFVNGAITDSKHVSYAAQTLTSAEQAQARTNIGSADDSAVVKITPQSLTDAQKQQARDNIGAVADADAVKVVAQTLTDDQKLQARTNIGIDSLRNIGEIVTSTLPLTDAGLHLLDGALIQGSGIYADFVDYIAGLYTADPTAAYFTDETSWQTAVTTYGVCGKFVYDSVANTVRLPKITGIVEGTTDLTALGDLVQAGLPNITGSTTYGVGNPVIPNGAFSKAGQLSWKTYSQTSSTNDEVCYQNFDASVSSPIYGNSTTVQPQTIKVLFYIVIATVTKTDIQVDIDNVVTDLNGKADIGYVNSELETVAPIGSFIYFAGNAVPNKYLLCNGAAVSRSEYADLFNIIGTTYGIGDGSTTFNLPNLIDKFLEGSGTAGTVKNAGLPNITGGEQIIHWGEYQASGCFDEAKHGDSINYAPSATYSNAYYAVSLDASRSSSIYGNSSTVQPPALTALPCIRYE